MFEQRGWTRTGLLEGPAPLAPSCPDLSSLLVWAERAPANGAWLDAVRAVDPASLSGADRIALVRAWERLSRGVNAGFVAAVGAVAARPCKPEPGDPACDGGPRCEHDWSVEDTGHALGLGRQTAGLLLSHSRELTTRLPGMLEEVADGRASLPAARRAAERTSMLPDALVAVVASEIAGHACGKTVGAFDRHVGAVVDRHRDPADVAAAHAKKVRSETGIRPLPPMADGVGGAVIIGPAEKIAALFGWARDFTRNNRHPDDHRTVGMRRLDALLAAILDPVPVGFDAATAPQTSAGLAPAASTSAGWPPVGSAPAGSGSTAPASAPAPAPDREAPRAQVALQLVLGASTLLGLDNEPGWLEGHGSLAAPLARALAIHPDTLQRLLTHPLTGHLLDLTPEVRVPSASLDRFIRARDGSCSGPACGGSARHVELDHIKRVRDGGPTIRANLNSACKRDHRRRHAGGWRVRRNPSGAVSWTDPYGNEYATEPASYPGGVIQPAQDRPRVDFIGADPGLADPAGPAIPRPASSWPVVEWSQHTWDTVTRRDCSCEPTDDYDDLELRPPPHGGSDPPSEPPCPF